MSDSADSKKRKLEEGGGDEGAAKRGREDGKDAFDSAAEIAARLAERVKQNAPQHPKPASPAPPPPLPAAAAISSSTTPAAKGESSSEPPAPEQPDGAFVKDIEINDLKNRYVLTKGATQQQIHADTGASVTTKGLWYPDKTMATDKDPPLYLHITADAQDKLDKAVAAVEELMKQELGPLIEDRRAQRERRRWPEEKIPIELESMRNFNLRAKIVGPQGLFVKYIQQETQTRVQIKGIGSGFVETDTGRESDEPMHIHVVGPDQFMVEKAAELARDLLVVVREEHEKARRAATEQREQPMQMNDYSAQIEANRRAMAQQQAYGGAYPGYGAAAAPLPAGEAPPAPPGANGPAGSPPQQQAQQQQQQPPQQAGGQGQMSQDQWQAWWASLDEPSRQYYTQYYAQYSQQGQQQMGAGPGQSPTGASPAPGQQGQGQGQKGGSGMYGAVPPPAGL